MLHRIVVILGLVSVPLLALPVGESSQDDKPKFPPSPHVAPTEALSPQQQLKKMKLPPGFEMQLVAAEPDIKNPMNIAFDAKGRLWVTMSSEYPFPARGKKTKDTVKILEDFGPDGKARKITTFAENLNIPIGVLPLENGNRALVFSIPNVWLLEDTDGDGKADKKTIALHEYGQRDTHGLTGEFQMGFDGWVYACHGFSNTSTVKGTDGSTITMQSGNTYRFKPDGSQVHYFTHGQVNPFGLSFDPLGNLYSCDCHSRPIYQLLEGAYYPSFGKPHDGIGFGPPMITHNHGSTAIAGIAYYAADHFPKEFHDNIFIGNVVTNRINRDSLKRFGSTYEAIEQPDLVVSSDRWFRPVDIKLGPDGALYVADFYNRIIGHYEVPLTHPGRDHDHGRIWRIVYRGKNKNVAPRIPDRTKSSIEELVKDLGDANLQVRMTATDQLVHRGGADVVKAAHAVWRQRNTTTDQRLHALWVLERLGAFTRTSLLSEAAKSRAPELRVHALRILAARRKRSGFGRALALTKLNDPDAFVQRAAALVLGLNPSPENVEPLLDLLASVPAQDTHLLHAVRMALRDQLTKEETWQWLLKQQKNLTEKQILALADVSLGAGMPFVPGFLTVHLDVLKNDQQRFPEYVRLISRYGNKTQREKLYTTGKNEFAKQPVQQALMLQSVNKGTQERGDKLDDTALSWAKSLSQDLLTSKKDAQVNAGIELAGQLRISSAAPNLIELIESKNTAAARRIQAASALASITPEGSIKILSKVLDDPSAGPGVRDGMVKALAQTNHPGARKALTEQLTKVSAGLQLNIARALAGSRQGGEQLLEAIGKGKASPRLLQDRAVENLLRRANINNLNNRLAKLTKGLPKTNNKLLDLIAKRMAGFTKSKADATMGKVVFEKNCAACHQIDNKGGKIAPQLDGVGHRGTARLLEDILDPNRNIDQEFRATLLVLNNGQIFTGLFLRQEGKVLVLADDKGKEVRYNESEVAERHVSPTSPMPETWAEQLTAPELYHLLAYLLDQKKKQP